MKLNVIIILSLLFVFSLSDSTFASERLIFAVDLIRHGDRNPLHEIPGFSHHWSEGMGELTPLGMHQEFKLGSALRKTYIEKYHLLPTHYSPDTIYVRSTDVNRTLMSAESFLLGLYPPGTGPALSSFQSALPGAYQPIPIHTLPRKQDNLLYCEEDYAVYIKAQTRPWINENSLQQKIAKWSEIVGIPIRNSLDLILLSDNLYVRKIHHVPLPPVINNSCANDIILTGKTAFLNDLKHKEITHRSGQEILKNIADYFRDATDKKSNLKYVLLSGHDITILSVMNTLGSPLTEIPRYASHLNFSLFEINHAYIVKISLNEKPLLISGCKQNLCLLSDFYNLASK